ncbi:MAG TPA: BA14K family protein, partial [Phyllobacterium sp.]|nr:BA14K family protein [Phyllobacterium sp.]
DGAQPWSPGWYRYCANRYRSFNPETGTFRGYDGRDYFCNVN